MRKSNYTIATPPGETIKEIMQSKDMNQKQLALRMGMSEKHICGLVNGDVRLTPNVALRLESVLGMSANFWQRLEAVYREKLERVVSENELDEDILLSKNFPYNDMAKYGWIPKESKVVNKVMNLRSFFEVAQLSIISDDIFPRVACRQLDKTQKAHYALITWVQKARLMARIISTELFDMQMLKSYLPKIREMSLQEPQKFMPELRDVLSSCGVALVILPHIKGSFLQGVTFKDKNKVILGLTLRKKDADIFWFSFFHEIGHILYGHIDKADDITDYDETTAGTFSRNTLIPLEQYKRFVSQKRFDECDIIKFAKEINIDKGIVVGRLQKDGYIAHNLRNNLKKQYVLVNG